MAHVHDHIGEKHAAATHHDHPAGLRGAIREIFAPHSHDAADSLDTALESSAAGIRAVKISLVVLGITAIAQIVVVMVSGSIALAADTIHNFSDALTAVPLWIAFALSTKAATRRYTYGFGRVEDLAGMFVVAMIAVSAIVAGYEAVGRLIDPRPIEHLGWVALAGLLGFIGNEWVALYRIRVGRRIGSAALVADGLHARTDGFTSLAVVIGAVGDLMCLRQSEIGVDIEFGIGVQPVTDPPHPHATHRPHSGAGGQGDLGGVDECRVHAIHQAAEHIPHSGAQHRQDGHGDDQADDRVRQWETQGDATGADDHRQRGEAVGASVQPVGNQSG